MQSLKRARLINYLHALHAWKKDNDEELERLEKESIHAAITSLKLGRAILQTSAAIRETYKHTEEMNYDDEQRTRKVDSTGTTSSGTSAV